jgi:hypothetical protein
MAITKPTGLVAGDLLLFLGMYAQSGGTEKFNLPTGWTSLGTGSGEVNMAVFYKIADSTDAAASSFTFGVSGTNTSQACGILYAIQSPDGTVPVPASHRTDGGTATTITDIGITPGNQCLLVVGSAYVSSVGRTVSSVSAANNNPSWATISTSGVTFPANISGSTGTYSASTATGTVSVVMSGAITESGIIVIAVQPEIIRPTTISAATSIYAPAFVRKMLATTITLASTIGTAVQSVITGTWKNTVSKHAATWTPTHKSD